MKKDKRTYNAPHEKLKIEKQYEFYNTPGVEQGVLEE